MPSTKHKIGLTVIVCTHSRSALLRNCLGSLVIQDPNYTFTVLIVDNASSDDTQTVSRYFCQRFNHFQYLFEPKLGLSQARNTGMLKANSDYVAYLDDDALADPDWVKNIFKFIQTHPGVIAFGGPYSHFSFAQIPDWYPLDTVRYSLGDHEKIIEIGKEWISGSNMIFHRQTLIALNGFSLKLGMKGRSPGYGEETDLLYRIQDRQFPVYYSPTIPILHWVNPEKLSLSWLLSNYFFIGQSSIHISAKKHTYISRLYMLTASIILIPFRFIVSPKTHLYYRIYHSFSEPISHLGAIIGQIKLTYASG